MKGNAKDAALLGLALLFVLGVPAGILGVGVWWVESRFGTTPAAVALGGVLALLAWVGGSVFTHRIKQRTQADMLDGLGELAGVVQNFSSVQRVNAQAALIDRRAEYEAEKRINALADQRVRLLLADRQAAERQAAAAPTWADTQAAPAESAGFRFVE